MNVVYLTEPNTADPAIMRGLHDGKCAIHVLSSISASIRQITHLVHECGENNVMLVADVQAGGFVLLALLFDAGIRLSNVMFYSAISDDIQSVIKAIQMCAKEYLIQEDAASYREQRTRMLVEEMIAGQSLDLNHTNGGLSATTSKLANVAPDPEPASPASESRPTTYNRDVAWDTETHFIYYGNGQMLHLSPTEGRVFGLLFINRPNVVYTEKIVKQCLRLSCVDRKTGTSLLRPHMMRLRRKLNRHPILAGRIINVRTTGYMFA